MTAAKLFRYFGYGEVRCEECVKDSLDANFGTMHPADWLDDEFGDTACVACGVTVVKEDKVIAGIETFYWSGTDNEDLYCVCGTPHPEQIFDAALPAKMIRRCIWCGAVADLDEATGDWVVRLAVR